MTVKVNDIIKAYDFRGVTDCYIIGKVVSVVNDIITATVIKAISENEPYDLVGTFQTPVQGASIFDDEFQRILVIG